MISPFVREIARDTGKATREVEDAWARALEMTSEIFGLDSVDFKDKHYKHAVETTKELLGVVEQVINPLDFLDSEKSAKEFIEQTVSGNYDIGNVIPPDEDDDNDKDDIIDIIEKSK